ncbi:acetyltransferase [Peribacillus frigoritolerans]|uniref:acetyltransferase n=1 Tax=Peribacillus frigoritolerans TaxID=450367 RepID=UPI003D271A02
MENLLILGAGGHGKVVSEIAFLTNHWGNIAFLDDCDDLKEVLGFPVIGKLGDYNSFKKEYQYAFVAIGNNKLRIKWIERLSREGYIMATLIHPFSSISKTSILGAGTVVMAGAVINPNTNIGIGCIINTSSSIDHDCLLEAGVHISPGVNIGGTVTLNKCSWACIGSSVINNITIGSNVIVAAGAVVNKNVPDNVMVAGVPATIKKQFGVVEHG